MYHNKFPVSVGTCCRAPWRETTNLAVRSRLVGCGFDFRPALGMQFVTLQECNLSRFRNAKVWFVRKHPSRLGKTKRVHLRKFIISSAVGRERSHCCDVKIVENCEESEEEVGDWCENESNDKGSTP